MESEKARAKRLMDNFKLTPEMWEIMYCHQNKVCFLCGNPNNRAGQRLSVDHKHDEPNAGLIRGLLCAKCNAFLGKIENAFKRLGLHNTPGLTLLKAVENIAHYLKDPPATKALGVAVYGYAGRVGTKKHRKHLKRERKAKKKDVPLR